MATPPAAQDFAGSAAAYERYVGRWSRALAPGFLRWAGVQPGMRVLDVGCGTGAVAEAALALGAQVDGLDLNADHVAWCNARVAAGAGKAVFQQADAMQLPFGDASFDAAVSALVVNFLPDAAQGMAEMVRVVKPGGLVAVSVWDYRGRMEMMRHFWDAAAAVDPASRSLDEGVRFPLCREPALAQLLAAAGVHQVATGATDLPTVFRDFEDYWDPFLGAQGPAPMYCASLTPQKRAELRDALQRRLPIAPDGSIRLVARVLAARGRVPLSRPSEPSLRAHASA